ncbi:MAG: hypothetical protein WD009_09075 [Phycisphaeraceae bacterium]
MNIFSKTRGEGGGAGAAKRDPRKARRFFEHAEAVADARNYDYAIECYVNGLKHDPGNMDKHEALRDVALRRKVAGGKPAGFGERFKGGGSTAVDKMLHAERLWSKDPLNQKLMRDVMKHAVDADEAEPELRLSEVAYWVGGLILENPANKNKAIWVEVRDLFSRIEAWAQACDACRHALRADPNNEKLLKDLKDLEAERTMQEGGYSSGEGAEEGGFRRFVRDADKQRTLERDDAITSTTDAIDERIAERRAAYEEDPQDLERLGKLVEALVQRETDETEKEAIDLLAKAGEQSGQYRYRVRIGDIKMKRFNRQMRALKAKIDADGDDADLKRQYEELRKKRLAFELEEYNERVRQYPTDMSLRFELGKRLYQAGEIDDAIGAFQQAKGDPKQRALSHEFLGSCYLKKGWYEEAVDTLRQGVEAHPPTDDRLGKDLRYLLMDALERAAKEFKNPEHAREAQKIASQILQTDINFRDIRERMDKLRTLVSEMGAED